MYHTPSIHADVDLQHLQEAVKLADSSAGMASSNPCHTVCYSHPVSVLIPALTVIRPPNCNSLPHMTRYDKALAQSRLYNNAVFYTTWLKRAVEHHPQVNNCRHMTV